MKSSFGPLLVWLAVFAGVFLAMQQFIAARETPRMAVSGANGRELTIARSDDGHYRLRGEINGEPVLLMIDTGASTVTLPAPLADRLGLQPGRSFTTHTANGTVTAHETGLDTLRFGGFHFTDVRASVVPNMPGEEILLGMNVLGRLEVTMRGERMVLRLPAD